MGDRTLVFDPLDLPDPPDVAMAVGPCDDPFSRADVFQPPFSLQRDPRPDPRAADSGLTRGAGGALVLAPGSRKGTYRLLIPGCRDALGSVVDTMWFCVDWEGDTPPGTTVRARAAAGLWMSLGPDPRWGNEPKWTPWVTPPPIDLQALLTPNNTPANPWDVANNGMLLVEVELSSESDVQRPALRRLEAVYRCPSL